MGDVRLGSLPAIRDGTAPPKQRLVWIRSIKGEKKEREKGEYVALLGLVDKDFGTVTERGRRDPRVTEALATARPARVALLVEESLNGCRFLLPRVLPARRE